MPSGMESSLNQGQVCCENSVVQQTGWCPVQTSTKLWGSWSGKLLTNWKLGCRLRWADSGRYTENLRCRSQLSIYQEHTEKCFKCIVSMRSGRFVRRLRISWRSKSSRNNCPMSLAIVDLVRVKDTAARAPPAWYSARVMKQELDESVKDLVPDPPFSLLSSSDSSFDKVSESREDMRSKKKSSCRKSSVFHWTRENVL